VKHGVKRKHDDEQEEDEVEKDVTVLSYRRPLVARKSQWRTNMRTIFDQVLQIIPKVLFELMIEYMVEYPRFDPLGYERGTPVLRYYKNQEWGWKHIYRKPLSKREQESIFPLDHLSERTLDHYSDYTNIIRIRVKGHWSSFGVRNDGSCYTLNNHGYIWKPSNSLCDASQTAPYCDCMDKPRSAGFSEWMDTLVIQYDLTTGSLNLSVSSHGCEQSSNRMWCFQNIPNLSQHRVIVSFVHDCSVEFIWPTKN
jgi:hypothetical protein